MNGPRIVIMQLSSSKQVKQWRDHCATALGRGIGTGSDDGADHLVVWQLSSANHRALARSTRVHADFAEAYEEVMSTRSQLLRMKQRPLKLASRSEYVWVGSLDAESVLMSARVYSTVRDTRDSITVAAEAFAVAQVTTGSKTLAGARRAS